MMGFCMKKTISLYIIILISIPGFAFAISGACSSHLGVNCSVYNTTNGDAICNDGTDSSVNYYLMDECRQQTSCASLVPTCSIQAISQEYAGYSSGANAQGLAGSTEGSNMAQQEQQEVDACNAQIAAYTSCQTAQQSIQNVEQSAIQQTQTQAQSDANSRAYIAEKQAELKNTLLGLASSGTTLAVLKASNPTEYALMLQYAGGDEYALTGLYDEAVKESQPTQPVMSEADICKIIAGPNSLALSGSTCGCISGYHLDLSGNNHQCVQDASASTAAIATSSQPLTLQQILNKYVVTKSPSVAAKQTTTPKQVNVKYTNKPDQSSNSSSTVTLSSEASTTVVTSSTIQAISTTSAQTAPVEIKKQKHWYDWLNPFSWF